MKSNWKNVLACGVLLFGAACSEKQDGAKSPAVKERPPERVPVSEVQGMYPETSRRYVSKVSAVDDVTLIARVSGTILKQDFPNGAMVKKGENLFVIEDSTYVAAKDAAAAKLAQSKAAFAQSKAAVLQAQAELKFAEAKLVREEKLKANNATKIESYDEAVRMEASCRAALEAAVAAERAAEASVKAAEAALADAEINLGYTRISSPINGKTSRASVSPGNYVSPGKALVNVVSVDEMYVNFWISMSDYMNMFNGSFENLKKNALISVFMANGSKFTGNADVVFVDNRVDKDTDTIHVRLKVWMPEKEIDGKKVREELNLVPDSLVSVKIAVKGNRRKPAVPVSAILNNGNVSFVYVLGADNTALIRPVNLIGNPQGNMQLIEDWMQLNESTQVGLKIGEKIVVDGTQKVIPNRKVAPVETAVRK